MTNRKMITRYTKHLKKMIQKAKLKEGIEKAMERLENTEKTSYEYTYYVKKLQQYKRVINALILGAERKLSKRFPQYHKWSIIFLKQGKTMRYWIKRLTLSKDGDYEGKSMKTPPKYVPPTITTHEGVVKQHAVTTIEWIKVKNTSNELHKNYIEDLAEYNPTNRNTSIEATKKMLYHQEELKARHKKHGAYIKEKRTGMLNELLIPQPSNTNPDAHMKVTNEKDIEMILLSEMHENSQRPTYHHSAPDCWRP